MWQASPTTGGAKTLLKAGNRSGDVNVMFIIRSGLLTLSIVNSNVQKATALFINLKES